jgi:biopolymer transport protein ExbB/TolQ
VSAEQLAAFVREFGLPLVMLGAFAWAILKRKLVTGAELDRMTVLFERERLDRIAAEQTVSKFAAANAEVAEAVREVLTEVVRKPDAYAERLDGPTRRGR